MFVKFALICMTTITLVLQAKACTEKELSQKAMKGALYTESLNSSGKPLTKELYSLSSEVNTYIAVLSYSGVQASWKIKVDPDRCLIESISKGE